MSGRPLVSHQVEALVGGAGSGKSTIGRELTARIDGVAIVHLDDCYHTDTRLAPTVPAYDGTGPIVNFSDPASIDPARVTAAIDHHQDAAVLIAIEGVFALALDYVRHRAGWAVYVDVPADIRLARRTIRKIDEGRDPRHCLEHGRTAHERHIAPSRQHADLVLDGTGPVHDLVKQLRLLIAS